MVLTKYYYRIAVCHHRLLQCCRSTFFFSKNRVSGCVQLPYVGAGGTYIRYIYRLPVICNVRKHTTVFQNYGVVADDSYKGY